MPMTYFSQESAVEVTLPVSGLNVKTAWQLLCVLGALNCHLRCSATLLEREITERPCGQREVYHYIDEN